MLVTTGRQRRILRPTVRLLHRRESTYCSRWQGSGLQAVLALVVALGLSGPVVAGEPAQAHGKPNIVVIVADDLGFADVGFNGAEDVLTPHIDDLAAAGTRFESLYVQPFCTPTRAAFMTGRYPIRYGLQTFVITPGQTYGLPHSERTLASALQDVGYKTYIIGKWHLGHADQSFWPQNRGFDYFYGTTLGEVDFYTKERAGSVDWQRNGALLDEQGYFTDQLTRDAVRIIEQQSTDKPFFLYLPHLAVHAPYQAPQHYIDRVSGIEDETRRVYAAMAAALDDSVGEVIAALERKGLRDNTLLLFFSDNGGIAEYDAAAAMAKGDKPAPADNSPFRGSKGGLYEGGVRSAAFINWPGRIEPGAIAEMVHVVDFFPTLVKLSSGSVESENALDGKDIWPVITGDAPSPHADILINAEIHRGAVRKGRWKLVKNAALPSSNELYDLESDVAERENLAHKHPEKVKELEDVLNGYAEESKPALFLHAYMPFVRKHFASAALAYDGDKNDGQAEE